MPELFFELEEVEQACPAPRVDALVGVTHRRHREPIAEDLGDQRGLGHVGVLIFIQHDSVEARAVVVDHLGETLHHVESQGDLVAEVDHPEPALQLVEPLDGPSELDSLEGSMVGRVRAVLRERCQSLLAEGDDLFGSPTMVGRLVGEG